jgi:hypothetical protein
MKRTIQSVLSSKPSAIVAKSTTHLFLSLLLVILATQAARGQTSAPVHSADQIWIEPQFAVPLNDHVDLVLLGNFHFGRSAERPVAEHASTGVGISAKVGKHVVLFPFYTHFENQTGRPVTNKEERLTLEATIKVPWRRFFLSYRQRFEYHWRAPPPNFIHERNRFQVDRSLKFHGVTAFLANEVFYDTHFHGWTRNRAYLGISKRVNKYFTFEVYYLRQNDGRSHPGDLNVMGSTLKFRL